jgi:hypothetical protein
LVKTSRQRHRGKLSSSALHYRLWSTINRETRRGRRMVHSKIYKCVICGRFVEGYVWPIFGDEGTPDYCYKHYRQRRQMLMLEYLVHGQ